MGYLAACPEGSPPGSCQDFRHRAGIALVEQWDTFVLTSVPLKRQWNMLQELLNISGGNKDPGTHLESLKELEDFGGEIELFPALLPAGLSAKPDSVPEFTFQ